MKNFCYRNYYLEISSKDLPKKFFQVAEEDMLVKWNHI